MMIDSITGATRDDKRIIFRDGFITVICRDKSKFRDFNSLQKELKTADDSDIFTVLELEPGYQIVADIEHDNASLTLDNIAQIWPDAYLVIYETVLDGDMYKRDQHMDGSFYWKRIGNTIGYGG